MHAWFHPSRAFARSRRRQQPAVAFDLLHLTERPHVPPAWSACAIRRGLPFSAHAFCIDLPAAAGLHCCTDVSCRKWLLGGANTCARRQPPPPAVLTHAMLNLFPLLSCMPTLLLCCFKHRGQHSCRSSLPATPAGTSHR